MLTFASEHIWMSAGIWGIFGLLVGSFLNVVIYRLPKTLMSSWESECREYLGSLESPATETAAANSPNNSLNNNPNNTDNAPAKFNIAFPNSHCPECNAPVKAWQNIPVISYLLLKGKCASCKTAISLRYPLVEITSALLAAFIGTQFGLGMESLLVAVFTWSLLVLTLIDIDHHLLPDNITLPLLWLGLIANSFGMFTDLKSAVLGAAAGYLSLWSIYWLFKLITQKEGMGFGDFKLLAALGAWMGWQALPLIIILSSFVGAIIGIAGIVLAGKGRNTPIPFGPYLAIAGWIAFFWSEQIISTYLRFFT